ncbi:hypothetical protein [Longimicrobium sp.]|uniref:hypothetical protein n=1 Tax=Longimicrobium sp. TaxID=2029185 RepID=UPI002E2FBC1F|nr:hypothetical protein [Longimicrobium sp.]HEX6040416.1 hypothetical protein [Longimicrobium sp.]
MGIRHWLRKKRAEQADDGEEEDRAPSGSIISAIFGREAPTLHALGEFDQTTYPGELQDLLRRREDVAEELREMDLTTRQARVDAIPRLQQMLRTYPHPLAYETLIHAYVDAGRWDEARGAAFAARERRTQVLRSPYSEIRAEVDRLKEWTPEEVELVRKEREGVVPPTQPSRPAAEPPASTPAPAPVAVSAQAAAVQPASLASADADPAEPVAPADAEPAASTAVDAEPAAFVSEPDSIAVASADADSSAESVAVLDAESTETADSADAVAVAQADGAPDEAELGDESDEPAGDASVAGSGASRPGGRGPKSQRKNGKRRK